MRALLGEARAGCQSWAKSERESDCLGLGLRAMRRLQCTLYRVDQQYAVPVRLHGSLQLRIRYCGSAERGLFL